ncbi:MAG: C1 family peptidase [Treponema sp.]|jgi:hypothetical protein|nr:C1 family peptidase [Treponema sp.]
MKHFLKKLFFPLLFFCLVPLFGQAHGTGAILDSARYEKTAAKPVLLSRNYTSVARSASLKQYSPIPESQGNLGTCVGWATAFAARTISESIALNRINQEQSSNNAFSPIHAYKGSYFRLGLINPTGKEGAYIDDVLDFIKTEGAVKRPQSEKTTDFPLILLSAYANFIKYPIADYVRLFSNPRGVPGTIDERALPVKKSLSEGKPVIIGMNTPLSFSNLYGRDVWRPYENPNNRYDGHALCVVGYDDDKYGGAFEIQNSWGTEFGINGYIWVTYADFAGFAAEAYEMIESLANFRDAANYAASIGIEVYRSAAGMPVTFDRQGFYKTASSYPSGTDFRFLMTNKYPAYVYAFSADSNTPGTERIFPLQGVSPVMDYAESAIAWPGETEWIRLDDVAGTDYLVVLYAKQAIDIDAIEKRFAAESGAFPQRVARAVGPDFIPYSNAEYKNGVMEFSAQSRNPRAVFGLLLAIDHITRQ